MKAFLINPEKQEISEIEVTHPVLKSLYRHIGCDCIDSLRINQNNIIWVDDEGLLKPNFYFRIENYPNPLAGNGVVLGIKPDGDNKDVSITLDKLKEIVSFYEKEETDQ